MSLEPHLPNLRTWDCLGCSAPWPCLPARRRLIAEYADAPTSLAIYMGGQYVAASEALYGTGQLVDNLFDRFITWQSAVRRRTQVL